MVCTSGDYVWGCIVFFFFFFKQKTAYEMCGRDWSSDVCSSDLILEAPEFTEGCILSFFVLCDCLLRLSAATVCCV